MCFLDHGKWFVGGMWKNSEFGLKTLDCWKQNLIHTDWSLEDVNAKRETDYRRQMRLQRGARTLLRNGCRTWPLGVAPCTGLGSCLYPKEKVSWMQAFIKLRRSVIHGCWAMIQSCPLHTLPSCPLLGSPLPTQNPGYLSALLWSQGTEWLQHAVVVPPHASGWSVCLYPCAWGAHCGSSAWLLRQPSLFCQQNWKTSSRKTRGIFSS